MRGWRAVMRTRGRYAASAALPARPLTAGAALGTAALAAVVFLSASNHPDVSPSAVGSTVRPSTPSATSTGPAPSASEPEVPHFDGANANAVLGIAQSAAAQEAAQLAELALAPDAGSVPTATVDAAQVLASGFVKPVDGVPSSPFGLRFHPILHVWKLHSGTDLAAPCGTPVRAVKAGQVTMAGGSKGYGNRVVIDHGGGLVTTYNHLTSYAAVPGLVVKQGQVIGYVGSTGLSTGCHLHFEVMVNGAFVDPAPYLDLAPAPTIVIPPAVPPRSDVTLLPSASPTTTVPTAAPTATGAVTATDAPTSTDVPTSTSTATSVPTDPTATDPTSTAPPTTDPSASTTSDPTTSTTAVPTETTPDPTATATPTSPPPDPTAP